MSASPLQAPLHSQSVFSCVFTSPLGVCACVCVYVRVCVSVCPNLCSYRDPKGPSDSSTPHLTNLICSVGNFQYGGSGLGLQYMNLGGRNATHDRHDPCWPFLPCAEHRAQCRHLAQTVSRPLADEEPASTGRGQVPGGQGSGASQRPAGHVTALTTRLPMGAAHFREVPEGN